MKNVSLNEMLLYYFLNVFICGSNCEKNVKSILWTINKIAIVNWTDISIVIHDNNR